MLKKITVAGLLCAALTAQASTFSKSDSEIIALANKYEAQTRQLAEKQTTAECFSSLTDASSLLEAIPSMLSERMIAKMAAQSARDYIHLAALSHCESLNEISLLDNEVKDFILDF